MRISGKAFACVTVGAVHALLIAACYRMGEVAPRPRRAMGRRFAAQFDLPHVGAVAEAFAMWATFGLAVGLCVLALRPHWWQRARKQAFAGMLVAVCVAVSLHVMARRFDRGDYHDAGDNYHYVLGARYFDELGYTRHYECSALALEELGRKVPRRMRNLRTNRHVHTREVLTPEGRAACRTRFTNERWEAFKDDLTRFRNWHSYDRFAHRFTDHGYNGTPLWTLVSRVVMGDAPIDEAVVDRLAYGNVAFLGVAAVFVLWAFGWELGLPFLVIFWGCFPDNFVHGGAHLRYLNISTLMLGMSLLRMRQYAVGGAALAFSATLLIFPVLFLVPAGLAVGFSLLRRERPAAAHLQFALGAGGMLALALLFSISHGDGIGNWQVFLHQMELNSGRLATGRIGLVYDFIWPKEVTGEQLRYEPRVEAMHAPWLLGLSLDHLRLAVAIGLSVAVLWIGRRQDLLTRTAFGGFSLFFLWFSTVRYYYAGLVCLPLMWHAAPGHRGARLGLASLALLQASCYALQDELIYSFLYNTLQSGAFTLYVFGVVLWFGLFRPRAMRRRRAARSGPPAASSGGEARLAEVARDGASQG